ncbi:PepSY domain-containing protein [Acetobacteraceae bacterium H6797]|nr:PepSY domain-containing protein [Acetobacteraceae bacterium H6797]
MRRAFLCSLLALPLGATAAEASRRDHERARDALAAGEIRPLSELLAEVESRYEGRVIETELDRDDGQWIYEFKLLPPSGRVFELKLDARTGTLLRSKGPVLLRGGAPLPEPR